MINKSNKACEETAATGTGSEATTALSWIVIYPLGKVYPGNDARVAGHPGVDLVVRQDECSHLDSLNPVSVVTEQPGHGVASDLLQLLQSEATGPATILIPKPDTMTLL